MQCARKVQIRRDSIVRVCNYRQEKDGPVLHGTCLSFLVMQTVTRAVEDMDGIVAELEFDDAEQKSQLLSKIVVKSLQDTISDIERILLDSSVMTKADFEAIVRSRLTKWRSTLQFQIVRTVCSTFEDASQESYFNSSNCLKSAMFNVVETVLGEVVRSARAPTTSKQRCETSSRPSMNLIQPSSQYSLAKGLLFSSQNSWEDWWAEQLISSAYAISRTRHQQLPTQSIHGAWDTPPGKAIEDTVRLWIARWILSQSLSLSYPVLAGFSGKIGLRRTLFDTRHKGW